jgi:hypothetical protein
MVGMMDIVEKPKTVQVVAKSIRDLIRNRIMMKNVIFKLNKKTNQYECYITGDLIGLFYYDKKEWIYTAYRPNYKSFILRELLEFQEKLNKE